MRKTEIMNAYELGAKLKAIRLEKDLSVEAVSRVLSLRPSLVLELENGNYREIGALLYAKNYLRKYAKLLDVQDPEFEAALETMVQQSDPKSQGFYETGKVKLEAEEQKRSNNFKYYLIFVVLVLGVCAYLYKTGVIPSPFKESATSGGKEAVFLPNERLPSLELEYGVMGKNITSIEDISFEDLLIDAVKEQQTMIINDYHGDESIVQLQSEAYGEDEDLTHLVVLNRESEISYPEISDLKSESSSTSLTLSHSKTVELGSGRVHVLGEALRNYAHLLSEKALPLIDLGSKVAAKKYVAPQAHMYYWYDSPSRIRLGVETPSGLQQKLSELHRYTTSIYDRESGFYPFVAQVVVGFRITGMKLKVNNIENKIQSLNESFITFKEDAHKHQKEIAEITQSLAVLAANKVSLESEIADATDNLALKSMVVVTTDDITTLDIQDVKGRVLANKVMKSGESYQLEGSGIYDVYLGNPAVVDKIMVNGKVIPEYYYKPLTEEAVSIRFSLNAEQYH